MQEFVYIFENIGNVALTIDSYEVKRTGDATTTVDINAALEPGAMTTTPDIIEFDSCVPSETTVTAVGNPGMCVGTDTYSFTPSSTRRRTKYTRGINL
jgi:hypothetical protein